MEAASESFDPDELLRHAHWMRALARRLVVDEQAAEDLVQDTWAAAIRSEPDTRRPLRPWLARVLRDFLRQRSRADARRRDREVAVTGTAEDLSADELVSRAETRALVVEEVQKLSEPFRETVLLRYFEGRSALEIANLRGIPAGTARWRLKRGLDQLRERLDARFGGQRAEWCRALAPIAGLGQLSAPVDPSAHAPASSADAASSFLQGTTIMTTAAKLIGVLVPLGALALGITYWDEIRDSFSPADVQRTVAAYRPLDLGRTPTVTNVDAPASGTRVAERSASTPTAVRDGSGTSSEVTESATVHARLLGFAGRPLRGVELEAYRFGSERVSGASSASGEVVLRVAADSEPRSWRFEARSEGLATVERTALIEAGATVHLGDIEMGPGGALSGRVIDSAGRPVPDAAIVVLGEDLGSEDWQMFRHWAGTGASGWERPGTSTDAGGEFRVSGVPVGSVRVGATSPGMTAALSTAIEVRAGEEAYGLELRLDLLPDDERIEGVVLKPGGEPLPHAFLTSRSSRAQLPHRADSEGRFRIAAEPGLEVSLVVRPVDGIGSGASVSGVRGGDHDVVLQLPERRVVELRVLSQLGEPVERYGVTVRGDGDGSYLAFSEPANHEDGRTELALPGQEFTLIVLAPGFAEGRLDSIDPESVLEHLECRLSPIAPVAGVVTANGEPVRGARVALIEDTGEAVTTDGFPARFSPIHQVEEVSSDSRGAFLLSVREPGEFYIVAEASGYALSELGPLSLSPETGRSGLRLRLLEGGSIAGIVVDSPERSAAGTVVGISRGDGHARSRRVGPDGRFRFEHLTPGPWQVQLVDTEFGAEQYSSFGGPPHTEIPSNCTVIDGEESWVELSTEVVTASVDLPVIEGRLTIDGVPAAGWTAQLLASEAFGRTDGPLVSTRSDGRFELVASSEGRRRLVVRSSTLFVFDVVDLSVGSNPWTVDVETGSLSGSAGGAAGVDGRTQLFLVHRGPGDRMFVSPIVPGTDGEFWCPRVPAGRVKVMQLDAGSIDFAAAVEIRVVDVPKGGSSRVDL